MLFDSVSYNHTKFHLSPFSRFLGLKNKLTDRQQSKNDQNVFSCFNLSQPIFHLTFLFYYMYRSVTINETIKLYKIYLYKCE